MKVIVAGCTHAGTAVASNIAKLYNDAEITVYENNDNVSFLSCGIALYVGGIVNDTAGLFYSSPEKLRELGINTKMLHEIVSLDYAKKEIEVKNLTTGETFMDNYDKFIITTGSWPIELDIPGKELDNIVLCKNYSHAKAIAEKSECVQNIAIVGAGYIGVELAEAFESNGKKVTLIDSEERMLKKYMDKEFTDLAEAKFREKGVTLAFGQKVLRFEGNGSAGNPGGVARVVTDKDSFEAELVVLCVGFRPQTALFKEAVDMLPNGAIIVDEYMRTSMDDIFAAGDSTAVIYNPTGSHEYIPLATNAVRMGTLAAINLCGPKIKYMGTQATSGIKIYDLNFAATGLSEDTAARKKINFKSITVTDNYRPEFMPTNFKISLKLIYEAESQILLGAQICSEADFTQIINTLSICIQNKMTLAQVAFVDQFFQPHFNKPWNILNFAALSAL